MKIYYENPNKEIKNIVNQKAKYQKVMLVYDDNISNAEINNIYEAIKDSCVYNHCHIKNVDEEELNNGYRMIIFRCSGESYLKTNLKLDELITIFYPCDDLLLPFFLNNNTQLSNIDNYMLLEGARVDINMISSVCFNLFFNYFQNILMGDMRSTYFDIAQQEVTQQNVINKLSLMRENSLFLDLDIIKKQNMNYENTVVLDLILINAFELLIGSIKQKNFMLVDIYKAGKDDECFIEKSYKLFNNRTFIDLVLLNYNCLINFCSKTKEHIKNLLSFVNVDLDTVEEIINHVKTYSRNDKGLLAYLYLYNFFDV